MGKPPSLEGCVSEYIAYVGERRELKHLSTCRNRNQIRDTGSSGERTRFSLNRKEFPCGVVGLLTTRRKTRQMAWKGQSKRVTTP